MFLRVGSAADRFVQGLQSGLVSDIRDDEVNNLARERHIRDGMVDDGVRFVVD